MISMRTMTLVLLLLLARSNSALVVLETAAEFQDQILTDVKEAERDSRFFFPLVSVRHEACATTNTAYPTGICYTAAQCSNLGGTGAGNCAAGIGTCCYFTRSCGSKTMGNSTVFVNPSSPAADTTVSNCILEVELLSDNICQLRLDMEEFVLNQPDVNGFCDIDFMTVTGTANDNTIPQLCGVNKGQHMYVDLDPTGGNPKINVDTSGTTTTGRSWKIIVDQIACDSKYKAPEGCTQYYTNSSGLVESFNYVTPNAAQIANVAPGNNPPNLHLRNLRYGVCVASRSGYCSITWTENEAAGTLGQYAFLMSGDAAGINPDLLGSTDLSETGSNCTLDYVLIPGGEFLPAVNGETSADRYCGLGFPTQVVSKIQPFIMYVMTDDNEASDLSNAGFSLRYRQNSCQD